MPTVWWDGPYDFGFWAADCSEPPHIHVRRDRQKCKVWLAPVSVASNYGFRPHELRRIVKVVIARRVQFLEDWHEFCRHAS